ncbi:MAG: hypothetical protein PHF11_07190, partial [Candidatus Omnitrophica bacterium]|nr:hypothetical protein [Candidatus Omnitrophota bacterium]
MKKDTLRFKGKMQRCIPALILLIAAGAALYFLAPEQANHIYEILESYGEFSILLLAPLHQVVSDLISQVCDNYKDAREQGSLSPWRQAFFRIDFSTSVIFLGMGLFSAMALPFLWSVIKFIFPNGNLFGWFARSIFDSTLLATLRHFYLILAVRVKDDLKNRATWREKLAAFHPRNLKKIWDEKERIGASSNTGRVGGYFLDLWIVWSIEELFCLGPNGEGGFAVILDTLFDIVWTIYLSWVARHDREGEENITVSARKVEPGVKVTRTAKVINLYSFLLTLLIQNMLAFSMFIPVAIMIFSPSNGLDLGMKIIVFVGAFIVYWITLFLFSSSIIYGVEGSLKKQMNPEDRPDFLRMAKGLFIKLKQEARARKDLLLESAFTRVRDIKLCDSFSKFQEGGKDCAAGIIYFYPSARFAGQGLFKDDILRLHTVRRAIGLYYYDIMCTEGGLLQPRLLSPASSFWYLWSDYELLRRSYLYRAMVPYLIAHMFMSVVGGLLPILLDIFFTPETLFIVKKGIRIFVLNRGILNAEGGYACGKGVYKLTEGKQAQKGQRRGRMTDEARARTEKEVLQAADEGRSEPAGDNVFYVKPKSDTRSRSPPIPCLWWESPEEFVISYADPATKNIYLPDGINPAFASLLIAFERKNIERGGAEDTEEAERLIQLIGAIAQIQGWKKEHQDTQDNRIANPFITGLQLAAKNIYAEYALHSLPVHERLVFINTVFDADRYARVRHVIALMYQRVYEHNTDKYAALTPAQYYMLANILSEIESQYSIMENRYIRSGLNLLFDIWEQEKRILEQSYLVTEIEKELAQTGSGNLPLIAAIQDMHGGARRALCLVGFVLGLPPELYPQVASLDGLKAMLAEYGIDIKNMGVRFAGLNDKYDRGSDPVSTFELVRWLRDEGKAKPFAGNHEDWRIWAVLGIHLLFETMGIDYKAADVKNHHIAYWAREVFRHAGWGDIELEQINQRRFNQAVAAINSILRLHGPIEFTPIDLAAVRAQDEAEMKKLKKQNAKIREDNELRKDEPGYTRQAEWPLPDIFKNTLAYLHAKVEEYNQRIAELNEVRKLDLPLVAFAEANFTNYWRDPEIIARTLWDLKNFRLFYVDVLGNLHMHSIIPIDYERGGFDVDYKGLRGLAAVELMSDDIRTFFQDMETIPDSMEFRRKMWDELGEAFTIINNWYSDITALARAVSVKKFIEAGGLEGLGREILGHIA